MKSESLKLERPLGVPCFQRWTNSKVLWQKKWMKDR